MSIAGSVGFPRVHLVSVTHISLLRLLSSYLCLGVVSLRGGSAVELCFQAEQQTPLPRACLYLVVEGL